MSEPLAVSINEAAHRIGVGRSTCYQLINNGELPSIVVGERRRVIPVSAIEQYVRRAVVAREDTDDLEAAGNALLARHAGNLNAALGELLLLGGQR